MKTFVAKKILKRQTDEQKKHEIRCFLSGNDLVKLLGDRVFFLECQLAVKSATGKKTHSLVGFKALSKGEEKRKKARREREKDEWNPKKMEPWRTGVSIEEVKRGKAKSGKIINPGYEKLRIKKLSSFIQWEKAFPEFLFKS